MNPCPSLLVLALATGGPAGDDARSVLLDGVASIAAPGVPGSVCAFGPEAFVVVAGPDGVPVIAAARAGPGSPDDKGRADGKGRAVALGHDGFLEAETLAAADTGRLLANAVRWAAGGKGQARVACPGRSGLVEPFARLGIRAEDTEELAGFDCVIVGGGDALTRAREEQLGRFVRGGGGLLVAATGWGWQQQAPGALLARDLPGNRLLVPFGLAFGLETAPGEEGRLATHPPPGALSHAGAALAALEQGALDPGPEREGALARVRAALACLPDHEPLLVLPLRRRLEGGDPPAGFLAELSAAHAARGWRPLGERWGEWHVLGPIPHPQGARDVRPSHPPEKELLALAHDGPGPDLEARHGTRERLAWTPAEAAGDGRELDAGTLRLDAAWPPADAERAAAYLYRCVELDQPLTLACRLGSDDGLRFWCNGELLAERNDSAGIEVDELPLELALPAGVSHLVAKVTNEDGVFGFRLRLDRPRDQRAVDGAIDRGVAYLLERQQVDGSWEGWPEYGPGYTAFCAYTLMKCGVPAEHPAVRRALAFVASRPAAHTYSQACVVLALAEARTPAALAALEEEVASLVAMQERAGLFSYPVHPGHGGTSPDLSNTLVAALAFRAAAAKGVDVDEEVWRRLIDGALSCWQGEDDVRARRGEPQPAGFSYATEGHPTGSMTTAGISVLHVAREALGGRVDRRLEKRLDDVVERSLSWLERHWTWSENPGDASFHYFFLYGVERLGSLLRREAIGGVEWYWSGAEHLLRHQAANGGWRTEGGGDEKYDTPLALLFLARATAPTSGTRRVAGLDLFTAEGPGLDLSLRAQGTDPLALWVTGWGVRVRDELVWAGEREPRVTSLRYVACRPGGGEDVVLAEIEGQGASPSAGGVQRFEARARLPAPGAWDVRAEALVLRPPPRPELDPEPERLASGVLAVHVPGGADDAALAYPLDAARNRLRGARVEESSHYLDQVAAAAIDGQHGTRWHCHVDDEAPWWRAKLSRPVEADRLLLSHAWPRPMDAGAPQPATVEVRLDGETGLRLEIEPDPLVKSVLLLPAPRAVQSVEVRILSSRARTLGRDAVGFSEIELLLGEEG